MNVNVRKINDYFIFIMLVMLISLLTPNNAYAFNIGYATLDEMFARFTDSSKALTELVKYLSYIIGIALVINSVFKFSQLGSNPQLSPKIPLTLFSVGIGILALTSTIDTVQQTMALGANGPGNILVTGGGNNIGQMTAKGIEGVLYFIRLVGYIAFVRGWLLLNQAGQGKEGTVGRGLTHLFGGVAAINLQVFAKVVANTFGWSVSF